MGTAKLLCSRQSKTCQLIFD